MELQESLGEAGIEDPDLGEAGIEDPDPSEEQGIRGHGHHSDSDLAEEIRKNAPNSEDSSRADESMMEDDLEEGETEIRDPSLGDSNPESENGEMGEPSLEEEELAETLQETTDFQQQNRLVSFCQCGGSGSVLTRSYFSSHEDFFVFLNFVQGL